MYRLTGLTFCLLEMGAVLAQPLELQYRFVKGQTESYHFTAKGQGQSLLRGLPGEQSQELTASFHLQGDVTWTVANLSAEGVASLALGIESLEVNGEVAGQAWKWKLATKAPDPALPMLFLKVKPNGWSIDEKANLQDILPNLPPVLQNLRLLLGHLALRPLPLPDRPVKAGETWEQVHRMELPYLDSEPTSLALIYQWQGFKSVNGQRCVRIYSTGEVVRENRTVPFAPWAGQPAQTVDLTVDRLRQTFSETAYFAPRPGRLERRQWKADFELMARAAVPAPNSDHQESDQQEVEATVIWHIEGTLMRRNRAESREP